eukprot:1368803-Amorphochlora_amoeboformis.AAC.1
MEQSSGFGISAGRLEAANTAERKEGHVLRFLGRVLIVADGDVRSELGAVLVLGEDVESDTAIG